MVGTSFRRPNKVDGWSFESTGCFFLCCLHFQASCIHVVGKVPRLCGPFSLWHKRRIFPDSSGNSSTTVQGWLAFPEPGSKGLLLLSSIESAGKGGSLKEERLGIQIYVHYARRSSRLAQVQTSSQPNKYQINVGTHETATIEYF